MVQYELALDFAVNAIVEDGLHVSPFDRHASRQGMLQSIGLTADLWTAWVQEIATRVGNAPTGSYVDAVALWSEPLDVADYLRPLWHRFLEKPRLVPEYSAVSRREVARLVRRILDPSSSLGLPPLRMCLVHYIRQVLYMPSPDVAALSGIDRLSAGQLAERVGFAAEQQRAMRAHK